MAGKFDVEFDVVIVGAGLAGLSTAMRLSGAGRRVTVVERESVPGGRAGRLDLSTAEGTYRIDTGPTVLTMPDLIADAFDCLGERMEDWLELMPVAPLYRAFYPDGSRLDLHNDPEASREAIRAFAGEASARGFDRLRAHARRIFEIVREPFMESPVPGVRDLLDPTRLPTAPAVALQVVNAAFEVP